jgi:D-alanyl-D-alanine carboxypeptidase (penicillin-binding protein 5/6)
MIQHKKNHTKWKRNRHRLLWLCVCFLLFWGGKSADSSQTVDAEAKAEAETGVETETVSLNLYAQSAVLMDGSNGRVLYEKDGYTPLPMASTTKIMTCILALEYGDPDQIIEVSSYAASMPQVSLGVVTGEQYRLEDLLYSLMLESHNDTAVVIAEGIAGSVEEFAAMMNQKARDIGAYDTWFITPNGLDATETQTLEDGTVITREHSTTAADLARILRYCIVESPAKDRFLEITQTRNYSFQDASGSRFFSCTNHNALLDGMEGAITGKTGFTGNAGYCYVGAVKRQGELYIVALLACGWPNNRTYKWSDMKTLISYGESTYTRCEYEQDIGTITIPVIDGIPEGTDTDEMAQVRLYLEKGQGSENTVLKREGEEVTCQVETLPSLTAPVDAGMVVGTVTYSLDGQILRTDSLKTEAAVDKKEYDWYEKILLSKMIQSPKNW